MTEQHLPFFVYGTLRPGESNYHLLQGRIFSEEPAHAEGLWMYSLGTYPMAVYASDFHHPNLAKPLVGELVVAHPDYYTALLQTLDWLEEYNPADPSNSMYQRVAYPVIRQSGEKVLAWVYIGDRRWIHPWQPLIPSGDWVAFRHEHNTGNFEGLHED